MDEKEYTDIRRLLAFAAGGMALGGLILVGVSIFGDSEDNTPLTLALLFIVCRNLFNIIRMNMVKKHGESEKEETKN